ncbi:MAG: DUF4350 domain-containing protein [Chitinophagaceae bacterium]|nr:DUF4350 domain-containing protein [Chitinophagaceae bacterium]
MKKYIPYILIATAAIATLVLLFTGSKKTERRLDERITFLKKDKIPYGLYVAYHDLKFFFPRASVYDVQNEPGDWDSISIEDSKQALIIITPQFYPDEYEMKKLVDFVKNGNDLFISSALISDAAESIIGNHTGFLNMVSLANPGHDEEEDSLGVSLFHPPFEKNSNYFYPGKKMNSWFYQTDTVTTDVIGSDNLRRNNFIHLKAGKGNLYVHLAPMAFSNYFLLYKNNIRFYESILSLFDPGTTKIGWDEYFLKKRFHRGERSREKSGFGLLSVLFRYPGLKAALLTAFVSLLLYLLVESGRKQRYIPVISKPKNDSLDFVQTIGRLYYDRGDHKNLCKKMSSYFLEHVRNHYKLPTGKLDDDFIKKLQFKTGCDEKEIREIVFFIRYADDAITISDDELVKFHQQLESFYKKV